MNPLISIIVPIYNGEKFLNRVLETMKNQTVHNFELIFITGVNNPINPPKAYL